MLYLKSKESKEKWSSEMQKIKEVILSSKCQITVPKTIRDILQVESGDSLAFYVEDGQVVLTNLNNINVKLKNKKSKTVIKKGEEK